MLASHLAQILSGIYDVFETFGDGSPTSVVVVMVLYVFFVALTWFTFGFIRSRLGRGRRRRLLSTSNSRNEAVSRRKKTGD
jgi:hypothetical protein